MKGFPALGSRSQARSVCPSLLLAIAAWLLCPQGDKCEQQHNSDISVFLFAACWFQQEWLSEQVNDPDDSKVTQVLNDLFILEYHNI